MRLSRESPHWGEESGVQSGGAGWAQGNLAILTERLKNQSVSVPGWTLALVKDLLSKTALCPLV